MLGTGGMGVVVAARHLQQGHEVALKMLLRSVAQEGESVARFLREGRAASVLRSPHAVRLLDFGETADGAPFLVMELLRGQDLGTYLEQRGPMPLGEVARLLTQACHALEEAHSRGIVHRDLKPSNLFLQEQPGQLPQLKILDFGISKFMGSDEMHHSLTGTRTTLGTPLYMSPEQVRNAKRVDTRTDVWSLGVLLQELLTGRPPFEASSFSGLCAAIIADAPVPIRDSWPGVPPEIEALVARCLEKDPARRLATVQEFAAILAPHAGVQLAPAPRASRSSLHEQEPTLAASHSDELVPSTERAPSQPAIAVSPGAENARSLVGVASSRSGQEPAPRRLPAAAALLLLLPVGFLAFRLGAGTAPPVPAAQPSATASAASLPPATTSAAPASSPPPSLSAQPPSASSPPSPPTAASSAPAARPPSPASRPPTTKRPGPGYSPTNDDRK